MIRRLDREGNGLPAPPVLSAPRTDSGSHDELTYRQPGLKQEVVAVGLLFALGRDYLEDRFTAADLLMTSVLRILRHTDMPSGRPALQTYQERCEAQPAFQKALADHRKPFETAVA
jgi:glutathione S-transferase